MCYTTTMELIVHDENDQLFHLMKSKMTTSEEQMFMMSHYLYLQHGSDSNAFVVDFDHVWKNVEFTTRGNAKRILVKKFTENVDYTISVASFSCEKLCVNHVQYSLEQAASQSGEAASQSGETAYQLGEAGLRYENSQQNGEVFDKNETTVQNGGQNKETILLTVDCFKQFCFLAATPKAKEIRTYYIKMENVMHEYYRNLQNKNNQLENSLQVSQHETAIERHKVLIDTHKNKWLVYFCKVQTNPDGSFILKVGETTNIKNRMEALKADFGMDVTVLDVFVCENSLKLEKMLHESDKFLKYKYNQLERKNKKFSTEAYCIPTQKDYDKLVSFAKEEMHKHNNDDKTKDHIEIVKLNVESERNNLEHNRIALENKKIELYTSLLQICTNKEEFVDIISKLSLSTSVSNSQDFKNDDKHNENRDDDPEEAIQDTVEHETSDAEQENVESDEDQEEADAPSANANANGPIVQIYHKNDCKTVVQTYPSILEATRRFNYDNKTASFSAIKKAFQCKTIYLDHRWHFIMDRKERDLDKPRNIGETVVTIEKNQGQVAMLDLNKTKVIKVFKLAKDAAKEILQHPSAMSTAIKHSVPLNNHYWLRWQYVDPALQRAYLQSNNLPEKAKNPRGMKINVFDSETNELVQTFGSLMEIQKELKISIKLVKDCMESNAICRGKYKFVKC